MLNEETLLFYPKGEWQIPLTTGLSNVGLRLVKENPRSLRMRIEGLGIPIRWTFMKPSDMPELLLNPNLKWRGGIMGSDTALNAGLTPAWEVPIYKMERPGDKFPRSAITVATTPKFFATLPDCARPEDLFEPKKIFGRVYTPYRELVRKWLIENGADMSQIEIPNTRGSIEGLSDGDDDNYFVVDVVNTGETMSDNNCDPVAIISQVFLGFVEQSNLSAVDQERVDYLREELYLAARRAKI